MFLLGWTGDFGDPDNFIGTFFQDVNPQFGSFKNQEIFNKLDEAEAETDEARRAELYQEANRLIMDFLPVCRTSTTSQLSPSSRASPGTCGSAEQRELRPGHLELSHPGDAAFRCPAAAAAGRSCSGCRCCCSSGCAVSREGPPRPSQSGQRRNG